MNCSEGNLGYCALVAVTTATDVGVATPSMAAGGGGVTGGGFPPDGGGADAAVELPPQPVLKHTIEARSIAMSSSRQRRASAETFDMLQPSERANARTAVASARKFGAEGLSTRPGSQIANPGSRLTERLLRDAVRGEHEFVREMLASNAE
jgi:hypothetical protein